MTFWPARKERLCSQLLMGETGELLWFIIYYYYCCEERGGAGHHLPVLSEQLCGSDPQRSERRITWHAVSPSAGEAKPLLWRCWGAIPEQDGAYGLPRLSHVAMARKANDLQGSPTQAVPSRSPSVSARFRVSS